MTTRRFRPTAAARDATQITTPIAAADAAKSHPGHCSPKRSSGNRRRRPSADSLAPPATNAQVAIGTCPVVAVGDVHGCASLLMQELEKHEGSRAELILLGDLIDRSPEPDGDRRVLELVWLLQANPGL